MQEPFGTICGVLGNWPKTAIWEITPVKFVVVGAFPRRAVLYSVSEPKLERAGDSSLHPPLGRVGAEPAGFRYA
jgi:hypothetical protein